MTLTSDDLESYRRGCLVDLNKYQYLVCGCIVSLWSVDVRTYGRTDIFIGFIRSSQEMDLINAWNIAAYSK